MPSPSWGDGPAPIAAAIAAATHRAWFGNGDESPTNRFLETLRKMVGPEELERIEMVALDVFLLQPGPPGDYDPPPPSAHCQICPGCLKLKRTEFTHPQGGRLKLQALRDPDWLAGQFEQGRTTTDVADRLGCTPSNVVRWADVHGLQPPKTAAAREFDDDVRVMHQEGEAPGTIARALGTTVQRVRQALARQGIATLKRGHHYHRREWWLERLRDRGMTKYSCAREAGIRPPAANHWVKKFGLSHLVGRKKRSRKYPELFDAAYLADLLRRHLDNYASAAEEVGCAPSLVSRRARDILGRATKREPEPHHDPAWWSERVEDGWTTAELADEAGVKEKTAREKCRVLGLLDRAYANNVERERERRRARNQEDTDDGQEDDM